MKGSETVNYLIVVIFAVLAAVGAVEAVETNHLQEFGQFLTVSETFASDIG